MESAIAKYDHVVQCMRELKQIYRNAEMSETVLSPHTVNFTQSGLCVRSISRYLQKLPEVTILLQGDVVENCGNLSLILQRTMLKQLPLVKQDVL